MKCRNCYKKCDCYFYERNGNAIIDMAPVSITTQLGSKPHNVNDLVFGLQQFLEKIPDGFGNWYNYLKTGFADERNEIYAKFNLRLRWANKKALKNQTWYFSEYVNEWLRRNT